MWLQSCSLCLLCSIFTISNPQFIRYFVKLLKNVWKLWRAALGPTQTNHTKWWRMNLQTLLQSKLLSTWKIFLGLTWWQEDFILLLYILFLLNCYIFCESDLILNYYYFLSLHWFQNVTEVNPMETLLLYFVMFWGCLPPTGLCWTLLLVCKEKTQMVK